MNLLGRLSWSWGARIHKRAGKELFCRTKKETKSFVSER